MIGKQNETRSGEEKKVVLLKVSNNQNDFLEIISHKKQRNYFKDYNAIRRETMSSLNHFGFH